MFRSLLFAALATAIQVAAPASADEDANGFTLLSYNIHGLFPLIAKDDPRDRMPAIGWLANRYDVVLFQEDFEYHHVIRQQMAGSIGVRGNGMGWDPRRVAAKLFLAPVAIFLPHFSPPYGAGISAFAREALLLRDDVDREPYGFCTGWFGSFGDCWALKGYQRIAIRTPDGVEIDVYNTHLEAGPGEHAVETRRRQLEVLARGIEQLTTTRALIVAGDFNIAFNRVGDRETILEFRRRLDLRDSGAGPELSHWRERDYILYRDGPKARLTVEDAGEATEFVNQRRALSDHPALYARFVATPLAGSAEEAP